MSDSQPSDDQALRWYAGILLEISPIDEATWDYDVDMRKRTEDGAYTLSVSDDKLAGTKDRLASLPLEKVQAEADAGDPMMRIELAIRYVAIQFIFTSYLTLH